MLLYHGHNFIYIYFLILIKGLEKKSDLGIKNEKCNNAEEGTHMVLSVLLIPSGQTPLVDFSQCKTSGLTTFFVF